MSSSVLEQRLKLDDILEVMRTRRLDWFGHVERKNDDDWVKRCMRMEVDGKRPVGRPKKTWMDTIQEDRRSRGVETQDTGDRVGWRRGVRGGRDPHKTLKGKTPVR